MHGIIDVHVRIFVHVFGKWQVNGKWEGVGKYMILHIYLLLSCHLPQLPRLHDFLHPPNGPSKHPRSWQVGK